MERNLIVLADGRGIGSDAICQLKLAEKVNEGKILNPGAMCSSVLEAELLTPGGNLHIPADSELTYYKVKDSGEWPAHRFTVTNITGRKPMRLGELSCRFCRATPDGEISLGWYTDAEKSVWEGENQFAFLDSLSHGDYLTHVIDKVIIRADRKECIYGNGGNTYVINGNQLMVFVPNESFEGLARVLYEHLHPLKHTPCKVTVPVGVRVKCGDVLRFRDRNSREVLMYVMKKTQSGQKSILECTGTYRRNIPM